MKVHSEVVLKKLDSVFCDVCGVCCKKEGSHNNEHALLTANWGYDSRKDLTRYDIDLCEDCFDKTIDFLKAERKVTPAKNDPLDGIQYDI